MKRKNNLSNWFLVMLVAGLIFAPFFTLLLIVFGLVYAFWRNRGK